MSDILRTENSPFGKRYHLKEESKGAVNLEYFYVVFLIAN
jgi:hypothetical protein